jgi:hypothetical protein
MKIDPLKLKQVLCSLVDAASAGSFDVGNELYWFVPVESLTDPTADPVLTLGSVADDWAQLLSVADGARGPHFYDLMWAASVLRVVANRQVEIETGVLKPSA